MMTTLTTQPEAITFNPQQSALIMVDMQNTYATPGSYLDLTRFDVSTTHPVIANIQTTMTTARAAGMLIIWFQNGWDEQYVKAGRPSSPNFHKSNTLKTMHKQPQLQGKLLAKGSWDYQLVDELVPQPGNIVLPKPRYSSFFNTPLDSILHSHGIHHLVFTSITTNICIKSTLHDGFFLEYFSMVLEDTTHQAGPEFAQKATLFNIKTFFGWVSNIKTFCNTLSPTSFAHIT